MAKKELSRPFSPGGCWTRRPSASTAPCNVLARRSTSSARRDTFTRHAVASEATEQLIVQHYLQAWDAADVEELAGLLATDAVLTMPPLPLRYRARRH